MEFFKFWGLIFIDYQIFKDVVDVILRIYLYVNRIKIENLKYFGNVNLWVRGFYKMYEN